MPDVMFDIIDEGSTVDVIVENPVIDVGVDELIVSVVTVEGPPGVTGQPGGSVERFTTMPLSGHRLVVPTSTALEYADATDPDHMLRPVWLTVAAWSANTTATLVADGPITEPTWNWSIGQPIYVGVNGGLTQTPPVGAAFVRIAAEVIDATTIAFHPFPPIAT